MNKLFRILLFIAISSLSATAQTKDDSAYVFAYFKDNGQDGLHLATSVDGYRWDALKQDSSLLRPEVSKDKLMRDPCIIQGPDGIFRMVWTVSWKDNGIGYSSSKDLIHWTKQRYLPVMAADSGTQNCWAPEITYDKLNENYMIYWASTVPGRFPETDTLGDYNHRIYYVVTKDFTNYTPAKVLFNPGFNSIDATIQDLGNRYMMIFKDETLKPVPQKNLKVAFSKKLNSGYNKPVLLFATNEWLEGPTILRNGAKLIVYFDCYMKGKYGAVESSDLTHWEDVSAKIALPKGIRHGTILKVPASVYNQLLTQAGKLN